MDRDQKDELIARYLEAEGRERRRLLPQILPLLDRDDAIRVAPTLRDPSPKVAARITSVLARHQLDDLFESLLEGLKPGKIEILRRHYAKIRS